MFERFTDQARRLVVLAQEEARCLDHNYIGTEHLLLGMLRAEDCTAARVLHSFGLDRDKAVAAVTELVGAGGGTPSGHIPFTPRAKKVLELSVEEASNLGHNYIGTEHLLLGLIRENEGVAAQVLMNLGLKLEEVREEVLELLGADMSNSENTGGASGGGAAPQGGEKSASRGHVGGGERKGYG